MAIDWRPFVELVRKHERFLLTSHMRPDCDALGSELGMAAALEALGKRVRIVNGDAVPDHLAFIDPENKIEVLGRDVQAEELADAEVVMVLDTSAWIQLGPMGDVLRAARGEKVVVDHHVSEDDLGAISFKDIQAEATGRLVVEAADALGAPITRPMAEALFAAMATDTGWFRFSSVTGDTYRAVGRLLDAGARPESIYRQLYEQETLQRVLLRGRILANAESELDGRLIYARAERNDFEALGAKPSDTEDVINMLLRVSGTEVALMFIELGPESVKVSFRSRGAVDVRRLAEQFGGGGHIAAAGATLEMSLREAEHKILDAARRAMQ
jgi:phosphoesterase RecJ-like protein